LALGSRLANQERLIDFYFLEVDAGTDPLLVNGVVCQLVALQRNSVIAIRWKVETRSSGRRREILPAALSCGLRTGVLSKSRLILGKWVRTRLRERREAGRGQKRKGQESRKNRSSGAYYWHG
jgi:hypothetical protein